MKKLISTVLVVIMVLSFAGCSLFSDNSVVKLGDYYTHSDPDSLEYDERIPLLGKTFGEGLEDYASAAAYPDNMVYDDAGNMIGMYDYDESTGIAKGYTKLEDGTYVAFPAGEEVNLGKPDPSKMVDIPEGVAMGGVVYGNKGKAVEAYLYIFLPDASASEVVLGAVADVYGLEFTKTSDTVYSCVLDSAAIEAEFDALANAGQTVLSRSAESYAELLMSSYGIVEYKGENAYKPFEDYEDPTDVEFDEKVVLVGNGEYAVYEEYVADLSTLTDVLYGKDGKMVAHYTYYTCTSKDAADHLMGFVDGMNNVVRVSDTVISVSESGDILNSTIASYIGYNVLNDDSVKDFTRMIEESFFSVVCS